MTKKRRTKAEIAADKEKIIIDTEKKLEVEEPKELPIEEPKPFPLPEKEIPKLLDVDLLSPKADKTIEIEKTIESPEVKKTELQQVREYCLGTRLDPANPRTYYDICKRLGLR